MASEAARVPSLEESTSTRTEGLQPLGCWQADLTQAYHIHQVLKALEAQGQPTQPPQHRPLPESLVSLPIVIKVRRRIKTAFGFAS